MHRIQSHEKENNNIVCCKCKIPKRESGHSPGNPSYKENPLRRLLKWTAGKRLHQWSNISVSGNWTIDPLEDFEISFLWIKDGDKSLKSLESSPALKVIETYLETNASWNEHEKKWRLYWKEKKRLRKSGKTIGQKESTNESRWCESIV